MGRSNRRRRRTTPRQIETCEPRLFLSAQPFPDFSLADPSYEVLQPLGSPSVQLIDAHDLTGLNDARDAYGFDGTDQTVVVIDSGVAYDHLALGGGFGTGYQVVGGWDFTEENDADPYDDGPWGSHGTHVSGIIASQDAVYPGVAPGVDLVALRIFNDSGQGYFQWIEDALSWVHDNRNTFQNPITTVNLSIGSSWNADAIPSWAILEEEFAQLAADGIFISVAAGNDFAIYNDTGLSYPAASSYVVPAASVDDDGSLSSFTQRNDRVIAAPGRSVISTLPDYVGNLNGQNDDFGSFSGTSMAAPYVAGASVLLREALGLLGANSVTQDVIYDWMRDTADLVFDAATGQTYHRLNLARALDAIMPEDDFGSAPASAHSLGTVVDAATFSGLIGRLDDRDYFSFTAGLSGTLTVQSQTTYALAADWDLPAAATSVDDLTFTLEVVAGETYVIGLGTTEGLGYYDVGLELEPQQIDLGTITSHRFDGLLLTTGTATYTLRASRDGLLTVEALFSRAAGDLSLELFDAAGNSIGTGADVADGERIDVTVAAGQSFVVQLTGTISNVDLRLTNLLHTDGPAVHVYGTDADDSFSFVAGAMHELEINGVRYQFDAQSTTEFEFFGGEGNDQVTIDASTLFGGMTMARVGSSASVRLVAAIPGDADLNGVVDQADYVRWAQGFGTGNPSFDVGDFNQDGVVNSADYTTWANHFGVTPTAANSTAKGLSTTADPDPSVELVAAKGQATTVARQPSTVADAAQTRAAGASSLLERYEIATADIDNGLMALVAQFPSALFQFTDAPNDHLATAQSAAPLDPNRSDGDDLTEDQAPKQGESPGVGVTWFDVSAQSAGAADAAQQLDAAHATESEPWWDDLGELDPLIDADHLTLAEIWRAWSANQTPHDTAAETLFTAPEDDI